uniref:Replication protein A C-terminal domain-containing protein n=1 Tax=Arion vulgaris TaxID=1028688 RepID=A0A0B6Y6T0_9EUPU
MFNNQDFNQSGFGQGGGFGTPNADEKKKGVKRSNNIVPMTVAQILTAKHDDDVFVSGNVEVSQVTLVGLVVSVNETATRVDYLIDDMTGPPLEVKQFNHKDADDNEQEQNSTTSTHPTNTYVRVSGQIRSFGGKRTVNAHKITQVTDMNELSFHILEVIYANATNSQQQAAPVSGFSGGDKRAAVSMDVGGQVPGLTPLQSQIQKIIRDDQSGNCSIDDICQHLRTVAPKAIREAIEFLSNEGHIYSTVDEEHFQATD